MKKIDVNKKFQTKEGYIHKKIAGNEVLISIGGNIADFNGYIELNDTASYLWEMMKKPITVNEMATEIKANFDEAGQDVIEDIISFLTALRERNMIEEV